MIESDDTILIRRRRRRMGFAHQSLWAHLFRLEKIFFSGPLLPCYYCCFVLAIDLSLLFLSFLIVIITVWLRDDESHLRSG